MTEPSLAQPEIDVVEAIGALVTPAFVVEPGGRLVQVNDAALRLWKSQTPMDRLPMSGADGSPIDSTLADRVLAGEWPIPPHEVLVHRFDGSRIRALLTVAPLPGSKPAVALCYVHPIETEPHPSTLLLQAGRVLGNSLDLDESLAQIARLTVPSFADWCIVSLIDSAHRPRRTAITPGDPKLVELAARLEARAFRREPREEHVPVTNEPCLNQVVDEVLLRQWAEDDEHLRDLEAMGIHAILSVPLIARERGIGTMTFIRSSSAARFNDEEVVVVQELATRLSRTIDHAELYRDSQVARALSERLADRLSVLATGSSLLVEAGFDFAQACRDIARLVCEHLGDACILTIAKGEGQPQQPMAIDHRLPKHREALCATALSGPPGAGIGLAREVYETGRSIRVPSIDPAVFKEVLSSRPHLAKYVEEIGITSLLVVPLRFEGKILGTFGLARDRGGVPYTLADELLAQDLADRVALLFEKDRLYREVQEALNLRDTFLTVASHELRTPLSTMRLQAQTILRQVKRGLVQASPIVIRHFEAIDLQINRLNALVEDLLDVSRITSGRLEIEWEEVDLVALSREVSGRFTESLLQAGCAFSFKTSGSIVGQWDRSRLDQVLTNLLSNAIKYGSQRPIEMRVETSGDRARVYVQDHGIGIAPADQQRIFERFERAVSSRNYSGLGLGLWITRQIVLALGGDIAVQSELNVGSTFTVELPLVPAQVSS